MHDTSCPASRRVDVSWPWPPPTSRIDKRTPGRAGSRRITAARWTSRNQAPIGPEKRFAYASVAVSMSGVSVSCAGLERAGREPDRSIVLLSSSLRSAIRSVLGTRRPLGPAAACGRRSNRAVDLWVKLHGSPRCSSVPATSAQWRAAICRPWATGVAAGESILLLSESVESSAPGSLLLPQVVSRHLAYERILGVDHPRGSKDGRETSRSNDPSAPAG
jgi:hypothetical protein